MATEEKKEERAKEQASAQLDSIVNMVKRLKHIEEFRSDHDDCELTDAEIYAGLELYYDGKKVPKATKEERETYHNEDEARELINEDPLSVEVRSDWHSPGTNSEPTEYKIQLCTGGPACQIVGELDEHGSPDSARIEYQDWFTPWIEYLGATSEEREALLYYARQFYFGE